MGRTIRITWRCDSYPCSTGGASGALALCCCGKGCRFRFAHCIGIGFKRGGHEQALGVDQITFAKYPQPGTFGHDGIQANHVRVTSQQRNRFSVAVHNWLHWHQFDALVLRQIAKLVAQRDTHIRAADELLTKRLDYRGRMLTDVCSSTKLKA
jgi:hypothetical protein